MINHVAQPFIREGVLIGAILLCLALVAACLRRRVTVQAMSNACPETIMCKTAPWVYGACAGGSIIFASAAMWCAWVNAGRFLPISMIFGAFAILGVIAMVWESRKFVEVTEHVLRVHAPFADSVIDLKDITRVAIGKQFVVVETDDQRRKLISFTLKNVGALAAILQRRIDQRKIPNLGGSGT